MKQIYFILSVCFFCQTAFCADLNSEDMRRIDQRLENILRESEMLPPQNRACIFSEVKSIRQILDWSVRENRDRPTGRHDHGSVRRPGFRVYDNEEFMDLRARIKAAWPYRDQILLIRRINKNSAFTIRQILELTKVIDFQNDQKEVVLILLPNAIDLENIDLLYDLFWSISDKETINRIADECAR